ncbi:hypothetical protein HY485_00070 [Candidatus Woesearchaeota archaeon]|nr:hypothetical protein [Candidatus Woesearchaeota archaeon]
MVCVRLFAVVNSGLESVAVAELERLGCSDIVVKNGVVFFSVPSFEAACRVVYLVRSVSRVACFLAETGFDEDSINNGLSRSQLSGFVSGDVSFAAECIVGDEKVDGREIAGLVGGVIKEITGAKVSLSHPDVVVLCFAAENNLFVGVDISVEDLAKRDYRIFLGNDSLKGSVAFSLLHFAGYSSKMLVLDPFCRAGTIAVEAALFARNRSPRFFSKQELRFLKIPLFKELDFDKLFAAWDSEEKVFTGKILCFDESFQHVNAAKKNAKIAGVLDDISFSRTDVEWLDIKLEPKTVDCVVTFPLQPSRIFPQKKLERIYEWFFRQCAFLLKKGVVVIITKTVAESLLTKFAVAHKFLVKERHVIYQGKEEFVVLVFRG